MHAQSLALVFPLLLLLLLLRLLPLASAHASAQVELLLQEVVGGDDGDGMRQEGLHEYESGWQPLSPLLARASLSCSACEYAVALARNLPPTSPAAQTIFIQYVAIPTCVNLRLAPAQVCKGAIEAYGPIVLPLLSKRALDSHFVCAKLGFCPDDNSTASGCAFERGSGQQPEPSWFPPDEKDATTTTTTTTTSHGRERRTALTDRRASGHVGKFLHVTDIHMDFEYRAGANAMCGLPLCCHATDGVPASPSAAAGRWGDYRCDAPAPLLDSMLGTFGKAEGEDVGVDFVVFTGDLVPHIIWKGTREDSVAHLKDFSARFGAAFAGKKVYASFGNHEGVPADQASKTHCQPSDFPKAPATDWLYEAAWSAWSRWLPLECKETVLAGGYYSALHNPSLRIVSLNTLFYDLFNWYVLDGSEAEHDPAGQFAWLERVLTSARVANERVVIIGHIPPGDGTFYVRYSRRYSNIVEEFHAIIALQAFGHTHRDHFHLFYDSTTLTRPLGVALMTGSVTPYTSRNPSARVFDYDVNTGEVLNYTQYTLDLAASNRNASSPSELQWKTSYAFSKEYNASSLSPRVFAELARRLGEDSGVRERFLFHESADRPAEPCEGDCVKQLVCQINSQTYAVERQCINEHATNRWITTFAVFLNEVLSC
eukprot:jgi/Chlat1/1950/Chrsp157S02268